MDFGVGENWFSVFGACGDEVKRMADEKPVETFESGRAQLRLHGEIVTVPASAGRNFGDDDGGHRRHRPPLQRALL